MKNKEFNLSEKIQWTGERKVLDPRHVKEFIKLNEKDLLDMNLTRVEILSKMIKRAGDELI